MILILGYSCILSKVSEAKSSKAKLKLMPGGIHKIFSIDGQDVLALFAPNLSLRCILLFFCFHFTFIYMNHCVICIIFPAYSLLICMHFSKILLLLFFYRFI